MDTGRKRSERLRGLGVTVQTEYQDQGRLKIRRSDGSIRDDVVSGVILDKKSFCGQTLRRQETEFNPGILYAFVFPTLEGGLVLCPNCGGVGEADDFDDGCPFCGSGYNLAYASEDQGSRSHADYVRHGRARVLPMVLSIAACVVLALAVTLLTGRTLRPFDVVKAVAAGVFFGAAAGFVWILIKSRDRISAGDEAKKARQETELKALKDCLSSAGSNLSEFTNAVDAAVEDWCFGDRTENADVVDFDLLDYLRYAVHGGETGPQPDTEVQAGSRNAGAEPRIETEVLVRPDAGTEPRIETEVLVRLVRLRGGNLRAEQKTLRVRLRKNPFAARRLRPGANFRACPGCGASLDLRDTACAYCGAEIRPETAFVTIGVEAVDS